MRYYLKFLWVGVVCGIFCIWGYSVWSETFFCSDIISLLAMRNISYFIQYLSDIAYWYIPLLFFQVFFGTYIYRHFCSASIYFFSRYTKRTVWFLRELGILFLMAVVYLVVMLCSAILCCSIFSNVVFDKNILEIFTYYIVIYSLYLFITTVGINIVAIVFNSNMGFLVIEGMNLFSIAAFSIVGNFFAPEGIVLKEYEWILKLNPFYYLVFGVKQETMDYLISILIFTILAFITVCIGCVIVNKRDFIGGNREVGGI